MTLQVAFKARVCGTNVGLPPSVVPAIHTAYDPAKVVADCAAHTDAQMRLAERHGRVVELGRPGMNSLREQQACG